MPKVFERYLVTGAAGFLGKVIVNKLVKMGRKVRALVLPGDAAAEMLPAGVELVRGDVSDDSTLDEFFAGELDRSCVIHCAGIISIASKRDPRLWRVNVGGTKNIIDRCLKHGLARVVCVSSVHAVPEKPRGQTTCEPGSFAPRLVRGHYAKSKAEGAQYALAAAEKGLNVSTVHPSGIIGPYDDNKGSITSTVISFCSRRLPTASRGGYDFADVRDVADGIISCCDSGRSGESYILSGNYASLKDILSHISRAGYGREPKYLPLWMVKMTACFIELYSLARRRPLFLTPYSAYVLGSNARFSHAKATRELGYRPRALGSTLDDMLKWLTGVGLIPTPAP